MTRNTALNRQQGNRHGNRLRLGLPASLGLTHETRKCLLDDISASGARLRIDKPLTVYGAIAWEKNGQCGLRFDSPLPREDMEGFLWITQHPEVYERICRESGALDWSLGIGD
jgi:hypothetical protein